MYIRSFVSHVLAIVGVAAFLLLTDCASSPVQSGSDMASAPGTVRAEDSSNLTRAEAAQRKTRLAQIKYGITVILPEQGESFGGTSEITFQLATANAPLRLDFFEGKVSKLDVNGRDVNPTESVKKYWIELPVAALKNGANTVRVEWSHEYSHQGEGLHKFIDPETKETFLYTQFESFDANKFMPCFDQPDLRAVFTLTVDAPKTWQVISTTAETNVTTSPDGRKVWMFPATPSIATYLFSLHAGPYKVWTDTFEDIPLRLFARPSLAKYVHVKEWFTTTKQGLKFYNDFFALKYPFKKYDQILVPEFNAGAMENVGAVTFSERYIHRSESTRRDRRHVASVILHEMAHMWFGDIVTMAWWNDLWLNESFADYMSSYSLVGATEFKEEWQGFYSGSKGWAYWEDGLVTTHPIEAPIENVKQAGASFDGITYGKGASVLKQLVAYMGETNFRNGVRAYFKKYAISNTTLNDFIGALQGETKHDLHDWADRWLKQSGTDKLAANWNCKNGRLKAVEIVSTPIKEARFRPQTVQVALFDKDMKTPSVQRVDLNQPRTTVAGDWACPAFVYPNYQDDAYARITLDPWSLKFAKENVSKIPDTLLRTMVWTDLWQMVRDAEMPLSEYIQVVNQHMPSENDEILLQDLVATISGSRNEYATILYYWPQRNAKDKADRMAFVGKVEEQYLKRMQSSKPGSDLQKFWYDNYVNVAATAKGLAQVAAWTKAKQAAPGLPIDLDRRWALAYQLSRYQMPEAGKIVGDMSKKDTSDRGHKNALSAEAVRPDMSVKVKWVNSLKTPKPKVSLADAGAVLGALFPIEQRDLAQQFKTDFFDYLKANGNSENEHFVRSFAGSLMPLSCDARDSSVLKTFLGSHPEFTPSVTKQMKVSIQEDERCQKIRAASAL